jgi:hypothetical protein
MALKIRRGTSTQRNNITPASGELIFDTTQTKLYVGNGSTAGGVEVVAGAIGGNLGSSINLNNFNIGGTGNIDITGSITASGNIIANGDITLGNAATDNVSFGADINSNIVPNTGSLTLGTVSQPWQTVHAGAIENTAGITINSNLALNGNIITNSIVPSSNRTKTLGSLSARWKNIYSEEVLAGSVLIKGNDIGVSESNANINIVPSGTGSLVTSKIRTSGAIDLGTDTVLRVEGGTEPGSGNQLYFFYNAGLQTGKIIEAAQTLTRTQAVSNAIETFEFQSAQANQNANDVRVCITTPTGTQLIHFVYQKVGGVGQVTTISNVWTGVKPITSVGLAGGSQTSIVLTTTNTASAGTVYDISTRATLFLNI